ncbi:hypothetical protein D3C72_1224190 [compost metagenome]
MPDDGRAAGARLVGNPREIDLAEQPPQPVAAAHGQRQFALRTGADGVEVGQPFGVRTAEAQVAAGQHVGVAHVIAVMLEPGASTCRNRHIMGVTGRRNQADFDRLAAHGP